MGAIAVSNPVDYNRGSIMADYSAAGTNSCSSDEYVTAVSGKSHFSDLQSVTSPVDRRLPSRAVSQYEPQTHTAQPKSVLNQLDSSLDEIISTTDFSTAKGREKAEEISDRVIRAISGFHDDLTLVYPKPEERAKALECSATQWINSLSDKLRQSGLTESEISETLKVLKDDTYVLIRSITEVSGNPSTDVTSLPAALVSDSHCSMPPVSAPKPASVPTAVAPTPVPQPVRRRFYIEPQKNTQCGRHSANAYLGDEVLKDDGTYENLRADQLYDKMLPFAQKMSNGQPPLYIYDLAWQPHGDEGCERAIQALDTLDKEGFILSYDGHIVCFKQDETGQWWLLDSLHSDGAIRVNPSDFVRNIWRNQINPELSNNAMFSIIRRGLSQTLRENEWIASRRG